MVTVVSVVSGTTYPLTPVHKSSPPPSAFQFLFLHKPSIEVTKVTESQNSNYIHTKISFDSGTKVAVVTQYRISYYFHATVSFNCGTKVAVVTRYQLPNYFHITTYPLTPLHKSSPPPSAFQFLFQHKPSIEVTKVTESQNSNYIHTTCHVWLITLIHLLVSIVVDYEW